MTEEKQTIAAFDFDGTITTKDTLFDFIRFYYGNVRLIAGLLYLSPILVLFKLGFIKNSSAKQRLFSHFFKHTTIHEFETKCMSYAQRITEICNPETIEKIKYHQQQNHKVIIVSASIRNWIEPWAKTMNISPVIGTEIDIEHEKITGKFSSPNCYGIEKVNRLLALYPHRERYTLYAYGDSSGDKELLALADHPTLLKK